MMDYAGDDQLTVVAQSCRHFNADSHKDAKFNTAHEDMSCGLCKNWVGNRCVKGVYDSVLADINQP